MHRPNENWLKLRNQQSRKRLLKSTFGLISELFLCTLELLFLVLMLFVVLVLIVVIT